MLASHLIPLASSDYGIIGYKTFFMLISTLLINIKIGIFRHRESFMLLKNARMV